MEKYTHCVTIAAKLVIQIQCQNNYNFQSQWQDVEVREEVECETSFQPFTEGKWLNIITKHCLAALCPPPQTVFY